MFGGGGYVDVEIIHSGLRRLEVSLQFGAAIAIRFGIGMAEVHAFGGIRYELLPNKTIELTGFIHIGGSVELVGLISICVELRVALNYQFGTNRLVGRAKLIIEIDITLFSKSLELDSGDWVIVGGAPARSIRSARFPPLPPSPRTPLGEDLGLKAWQEYRRAFA